MIQTCQVTNLLNGAQFTFNDDIAPTGQWTMDVDLRNEDRERPLEHGLYESYSYYGKRLIHAEGKLMGGDAVSYMQNRLAMHKALILPPKSGTRSPLQLDMTFYGINSSLRAMATLDTYPELPMSADYFGLTEYMVSFKCFDPLLYGAIQHSTSLPAPTVRSGAPFPLTFPITFIGSSGADGLITNNGNVSTYPIITVTGPVTNPHLINLSTDESLRFDGLVLNAGDDVTIDFKQRIAISSAGGNFYGNITSDSTYWQLAPGDTNIRFTAERAASPSTATFYWYDAYML